eukprot:1184332-Prorocentrum_minimum.AAC.1
MRNRIAMRVAVASGPLRCGGCQSDGGVWPRRRGQRRKRLCRCSRTSRGLSRAPTRAKAWEHSGNVEGTFREHSGNVEGTFREHSGNVEGTFREHSRGPHVGPRVLRSEPALPRRGPPARPAGPQVPAAPAADAGAPRLAELPVSWPPGARTGPPGHEPITRREWEYTRRVSQSRRDEGLMAPPNVPRLLIRWTGGGSRRAARSRTKATNAATTLLPRSVGCFSAA